MRNASFIRKIIYLVLLAVLLIPLYVVSAPSFLGPDGQRSEGGKLTQLREEYQLSQANLGDIDPASESMKLATLGMRGIAANLMWERANEYKKKEQWDNLRATLNQIAMLQPNFITVWSFQAWNLSYNVSVEFDNYEHRYHWVKKGIDFLMQGIRYNRNEPRLLWDLGWFFGHKVGRSDEAKQFRRKYNTDTDFHDSLRDQISVADAMDYKNQPDNWLTAHQWFNEAQRVVDLEGVPIKGKNPLVFHSDSAKALIRYADAIEQEGQFEDVARLAWLRANLRWNKYGERDIPTSYGYKIRLREGEKWNEDAEKNESDFYEFLPGLKEKIYEERYAKLTDQERALLNQDRANLSAEDYDIAVGATAKVAVTPEDMVAAAPPEKRREAKLMARRIVSAKAYSTTIRRYRDVVNYIYWRTRCEVEQEDRALEGRQYLWEANELYQEADLEGAKEKYNEAWERWASIHRDHQILAEDVTAEDLVDSIKKYRTLLGQLDEDFPPENFPMLRLVANYSDDFGLSSSEAAEILEQADAMDAAAAATGAENDAVVSEPSENEAADSEAVESEAESPDASEQAPEDEAETDASDNAANSQITDAIAVLAEANALFEAADLNAAKTKFADAWPNWKQLVADGIGDHSGTLNDYIKKYRVLLGQLDEAFPPQDFPLLDYVKANSKEFGYSAEDAAALVSSN